MEIIKPPNAHLTYSLTTSTIRSYIAFRPADMLFAIYCTSINDLLNE